VCAGGRYDKLVEQLGGAPTSAVGFALGIERIILLMETLNLLEVNNTTPSLFMVATTKEGVHNALMLAESIRSANPNLHVITNTAGGSFKSQFKKADKSGARLALILGEDEVAKKTISIKDLRNETEQITVEQQNVNQFLNDYLV
jgi:histidyl-tRNA synthetase